MHDDAALGHEPRVARGGERVLEADLGLVAAAEHRALADVVLHARGVAGRALDDEPRLAVAVGRRGRPATPGACRSRRAARPHGRAARPSPIGARAGPCRRAARDPQQEQVEDGEEAELQRDGDRLEHQAVTYSTSKRDVDGAERRARSPDASGCGSLDARRPLTRTPLVEPRSVIVQPSPRGRISAWLARDVGVAEDDVALAAAADRRRRRAATA